MCTKVNLQDLQNLLFSVSLYKSLTVHDKIYNTNLLLNLSSVFTKKLYSEVNGPERSY